MNSPDLDRHPILCSLYPMSQPPHSSTWNGISTGSRFCRAHPFSLTHKILYCTMLSSFEWAWQCPKLPAIKKCIFESRQQNQWLRRRWNNNACESWNHVLKLAVDWRPRRLPDLVEWLHKVVAMQMADLRHALHSQGNCEVSSTFGKFAGI